MYIRVVKPCLDFLASLCACIFLIPVSAIVGILIKRDDGGSVFYRAKRLGKDGKVFDMYKFRSMSENAPDIRNTDGTTFSAPDDPRLTKVGKKLRETSIDELPQFINVLKGEMSILGPRPDPPEWYEINSGEVRKKYSIRPGISGYTQAFYRNSLPLEEKNRSDVFYAENVSFSLDVKIFFKTLSTIFSHSDVYRNDTITDTGEVQPEGDSAQVANESSEPLSPTLSHSGVYTSAPAYTGNSQPDDGTVRLKYTDTQPLSPTQGNSGAYTSAPAYTGNSQPDDGTVRLKYTDTQPLSPTQGHSGAYTSAPAYTGDSQPDDGTVRLKYTDTQPLSPTQGNSGVYTSAPAYTDDSQPDDGTVRLKHTDTQPLSPNQSRGGAYTSAPADTGDVHHEGDTVQLTYADTEPLTPIAPPAERVRQGADSDG